MAYKPPSQTIVDNDVKNFPSSEAIFEALKLKLDEPSVSGTAGQLLQLDGYVSGEPVMSWVNPPASGANTTLSNLVAPTAVNVPLLGTLGSVSAPAYSFTGDTNTGMWSAAADTLNFSANGTERMSIIAGGNVGIGTSTPTKKLEVAGAVKADEFTVTRGGGEVYRLDPHTHDEGTETTNFQINWSTAAVHSVTLNAAGPLVITMVSPVDGGAYALRIIQGATPGTVTWPASVKWPGGTPPTLSTGVGDVDVVNLLYYADTGFYYATFALDFA